MAAIPSKVGKKLELSAVGKKLDLVDKLYQRSILPSVMKVARGERLSAPLVVDLDPTSFCDLSCPECISANILNDGQLERDRIEQLAEELAGSTVKAVILIGGGEPLMHKSVGKIIATLAGAGIRVGLVTNGTLIHRYIDEIAEHLSWTRVSMDAATARTHRIFRPSGRLQSVFPTIVENMRALAKKKKGTLGYSFLLMKRELPNGEITTSNYGELLAAGKVAKDIGCDYFEVKAAFDQGHFILPTSPKQTEELREQSRLLAGLEDDGFRVLRSSTFRSILDGKERIQQKEYARCLTTELRTTVTPSGVYVCPYHRGNAQAKIGDIRKEAFLDMWKRADGSIVDPRRQCQFHCARHDTNLELARLVQLDFDEKQLVDDFDLFI